MRYITGFQRQLQRRLFQEIDEALRAPNQHALILIVPEQYTLQAELDLVDGLDLAGSFRLQVLSPARLHARIFEQAGKPDRVRIDERGRVMLMHAALQQLKEELKWYRAAERRKGFAQLIVEEISTLKQAGLTPESTASLADSLQPGTLQMKLWDLAVLYQLYEQQLEGKFLDGDDEAQAAAQRSVRTPLVRDAQVWVYGFDLITPNLTRLLSAMHPACKEISVLLQMQNDANAGDYDVYSPALRSLAQLKRHIDQTQIPWEHVRLPEGAANSTTAKEITFLEKHLYSWSTGIWPNTPEHIHLSAARSVDHEAMKVAATVRYLVQTKGWRYRDVALACQNLEGYQDALARAFALYEVPLFLESSRPATSHGLVRFVLNALRVVGKGWQTDEVIALLKSGYTPLNHDEISALENYALAYGLKGRRWKNPFDRGAPKEAQLLEPFRQLFAQPILDFEKQVGRKSTVARQMEALFALLQNVGAFAALDSETQKLIDLNARQSAVQSAQVWNQLMGAMDQLYLLLGPNQLPLTDTADLLEQALNTASIKALPQSGDAVAGGSLKHFKSQPIKALFLVGMDDAQEPPTAGVLQDDERRQLREKNDLWLGMEASERSALKRLSLKGSLQLAEQELYISYAQSNGEGASTQPGSFIGWVKRMFPKIAEQSPLAEDSAVALGAADAALRLLAPRLGLSAQGEHDLSDIETFTLQALAAHPTYRKKVSMLRQALSYRVESEPLPPHLANLMYGAIRSVSVSRLESYERCPFAHFVRYGLAPEPLREYAITPPDEGTFFHSALEGYVNESIQANDLDQLDKGESRHRMDKLVDALLSSTMDALLTDSSVNRAQAQQLRRKARSAAWALTKQLSGSGFQPCAVELDFSKARPRVKLHPASGDVELSGIIDRVDLFDDGSTRYLRIIDYKRGMSELKLDHVYAGLQLQLLIYLAVAVALQRGNPAGVFYFKVDDPLVDSDSRDADALENERLKRLKLSGLALSDPEILSAMAQDQEQAIGVKYTKTGDFYKSAPVISAQQFNLLMKHALSVAEQALDKIRQGDTRILPALLKNYDSCQYCEYRSLCQFDAQLQGAQHRRLEALSAKEVFEKLEEEAQSEMDR